MHGNLNVKISCNIYVKAPLDIKQTTVVFDGLRVVYFLVGDAPR